MVAEPRLRQHNLARPLVAFTWVVNVGIMASMEQVVAQMQQLIESQRQMEGRLQAETAARTLAEGNLTRLLSVRGSPPPHMEAARCSLTHD